MARVLVVYASDFGNTKRLAEEAAIGARAVAGVEAVVQECSTTTAEDFKTAAGVILASPVHMGSMHWKMKKCIDTVCSGLWMADALNGKAGGVLVTGGGYGNAGGGCELTMLAMLNNLAELGMILVPLPKKTPGYAQGGLQWGPYGRTGAEDMGEQDLAEGALRAARCHGTHVARLAKLLADSDPIFA